MIDDVLNKKQIRKIGLSGSICSGKTTVTKYLNEKRGIKVVDCDVLGHKAYIKGTTCYSKLVDHFGERIINVSDGSINRKALGSIVFSSKSEMDALTSIVWPEIALLIQSEVNNSMSDEVSIIVFEAAILIEAGWNKLMDEVWILDCEENVCVERLMKRNSISKEDAEKRILSQISNDERKKYASILKNTLNGEKMSCIIDSSLEIEKVVGKVGSLLDFKEL